MYYLELATVKIVGKRQMNQPAACTKTRFARGCLYFAVSLLVFTGSLRSALAAPDAVPVPAARPTAGSAEPVRSPDKPAATSLQQTYDGLQGLWEAIYKTRDVAQDLVSQGKYWAPRKDWLEYYTAVIGQGIGIIQQEVNNTQVPPDRQAALSDDWNQMGVIVQDLNSRYRELQNSVNVDQSQLVGAPFHAPAKAIEEDAQKLDRLVLDIYSKLCPAGAAAACRQAQGMAGSNLSLVGLNAGGDSATASAVTLKGGAQVLEANAGVTAIDQAADKMHKAAFGLINELERWNLLWGQPPPGGPANYLYGGGFTPKEIESQYRYLPEVAFTFPSYVQRFSYRLPPRENMLVMYTTEIGKLINLMNREIDETLLPPQKQEELSGPMSEVQNLFKAVISSYMDLLKMVNQATDARLKKNIRQDELDFGKPTVAIYDDSEKLRSVLTDVKQIVRQ